MIEKSQPLVIGVGRKRTSDFSGYLTQLYILHMHHLIYPHNSEA